MYQNVLGVTTAVAGIATLPNTGSNAILTTLSIVSIVAGVAVLATSALRFVAKRRHNI